MWPFNQKLDLNEIEIHLHFWVRRGSNLHGEIVSRQTGST
ncbi:hypothetical protein AcdelDRAFT_0104 [Acidovorax delafieldii 2AN]|jgi:hypothetical protein|uniref:Uncharacterized protein n=1 Tax=Acidovorax delafieldii 2AN TaxID=573060 RepID=C5SZM4_ACIDE|nr:hypothetical protein AcdelDRAFT_0104 [Acidovorax delafieldii 2AN]